MQRYFSLNETPCRLSAYFLRLQQVHLPQNAFDVPVIAAVTGVSAMGELWLPDETGQIPLITASSAPAAANYSSNDEHRARTPPPDLPSLLLDSRIVFLGMPVRDSFIAKRNFSLKQSSESVRHKFIHNGLAMSLARYSCLLQCQVAPGPCLGGRRKAPIDTNIGNRLTSIIGRRRLVAFCPSFALVM